MSRTKKSVFRDVDWVLILIYCALVIMGFMNIYAATYDPDTPGIMASYTASNQLKWILVSAVLIGIIFLLEPDFFQRFSWPILGVCVLLLLLVLLIGKEINGNKSWIVIPGVMNLQPAEFAKIGVALALSRYMSSFNTDVGDLSRTLLAAAIAVGPAVLILLQPDTGSALVFASFVFVMYREGLSGNILLLGFLAIIMFILALLFDNLVVVVGLTGAAAVGLAVISGKWKYALPVLAFFGLVFVLANYTDVPPLLVVGLAVFGGIGHAAWEYIDKRIKVNPARMIVLLMFVAGTLFTFSVDYAFTNILKEHQRTRITVLLGEEDKLEAQIEVLSAELKEIDRESLEYQEKVMALREMIASVKNLRLGAGYNVNQSKIAIGSGGLVGKGYLQGTQTKGDFVPEQSTDFIFCTVGEEWGLLGSVIVIGLFVTLMFRVIVVAERQRSAFVRIYGYCVASIFFFHMAINLGMTMGLVPVIGIPLPFFSYGGSSLLAFTVLLFAFIRMDSMRMTVLR